MNLLKIFKEVSLPGTLEPHAMYFIENGDYAESYITDDAGVGKYIGNTQMINELINAALASTQGVEIVADIAARDLAFTGAVNKMALVIDASADATVDSGSAYYAYDASGPTVYKVAEFESMDMSFDWADIVNGPASTPTAIDNAVSNSHQHTASIAAIDQAVTDSHTHTSSIAAIEQAVTDSHTHANTASLVKLGEDANGFATYGGAAIQRFETANW